MYCFFENSGDLLRQRSMFRCCPAAKRLFQMVGYVCANEHAFPICHLPSPHVRSPDLKKRLANYEQVYKPNSVSRRIGTAIIHLGQSLPNGSSDLPGGRCPSISNLRSETSKTSGGQPLTPPYLVLHCEEFAWPRMSPRAPVRSYIKSRGTAPFHPSPS